MKSTRLTTCPKARQVKAMPVEIILNFRKSKSHLHNPVVRPKSVYCLLLIYSSIFIAT